MSLQSSFKPQSISMLEVEAVDGGYRITADSEADKGRDVSLFFAYDCWSSMLSLCLIIVIPLDNVG